MRTKDELIEYIKTFNKNSGEYNINEILDIGSKLKELPINERDWRWLHSYLGITSFSSEALRHRVNRYIQNRAEAKESIEFRENYSSKYKEREWVNAYRRAIREEVRIDNFKDEIQLAVSRINALPIITPHPLQFDEFEFKQEAVLLFSDLHIGVDCDNYYNKYNLDIAEERVNKLVDEVIYYCKVNRVQRLNVLNLGDLIHGCIHTNARIEQQMDVVTQVMYAAEILSQFLNALTELGIEITYRSVFDNHSRIIADKTQHIEKEQFSRIIDWYVAERLKDKPIIFVNDNIDGGIGKFKIFSKVAMFSHGHQGNKNSSLQEFIGLTREWIDYIFLAHYHNPAMKDYQGCKVFINGSIVGTEQYAFGKRLFTKPSQKLLVFQENSNNIIDIDIML